MFSSGWVWQHVNAPSQSCDVGTVAPPRGESVVRIADEHRDDDRSSEQVHCDERDLRGGVVRQCDGRSAGQRRQHDRGFEKPATGALLRRLRTARSSPPMTAPRNVICAKPASGIISPSTASGTPMAWTAAATAVVRAAAASPTTTVERRSERGRETVGRGSRGQGGDGHRVAPWGSAAPMRRSPPPRTRPLESTTDARELLSAGESKRPSPFVVSAATRHPSGPAQRGHQRCAR